jgi:excisionase family DNA binding protein
MSRRRQTESNAPFQTIDATARLTGLSRDYIRRGVKCGEIPAIKAGSGSNAPYMIDTALFLERLHRAAEQGART